MAPSEDVLREQIVVAKRVVETDLAELRTQLADLQRKLAVALAVVATLMIAMKIGRRIWRGSRG